jgi:small subunit ribosomal protein S23
MELEDKTYEAWKEWATKEIEAIDRQRESAYTGVGTGDDDPAVVTEVVDAEEESAVL